MDKSVVALYFMAGEVERYIARGTIIDGNTAIKEMCKDAAFKDNAILQNGHLLKSKNRIMAEDADLDTDMHLCGV